MGSSPLARGTQILRATPVRVLGLIPARAGNTSPLMRFLILSRAHPRSRGEHCFWLVQVLAVLGSSPLARGTRVWHPGGHSVLGLIPARAGNTVNLCPKRTSIWAHPRSRGEHQELGYPFGERSGSSPLARGTPGPLVTALTVAGLIPARAGNTSAVSPCLHAFRAHPRSRGEHMA